MPLLDLLLLLKEESEHGVPGSGFIWWDDESSQNEAFLDFMVESEGAQGR